MPGAGVEQVGRPEQAPDVVGAERRERSGCHVSERTPGVCADHPTVPSSESSDQRDRAGSVSSGTRSSVARMADVLLFHHIQGLTPGVVAFADDLRAAVHTVHVPDLFEGRTFDTIKDGAAYTRSRTLRTSTRWPTESRRSCRRDSSTRASRSAYPWPSGWRRPAPARAARCSSRPASRSPGSGRSARGPTACRSRSTAWTTTSSSRTTATWTRRARSPRR